MTATLNSEMNSGNESGDVCVCKMSFDNNDVSTTSNLRNDFSVEEIMSIYESIFEDVMNALMLDFSENFTSNLGAEEHKLLSKRFQKFFEHSVYGGGLTRSRLSFAVYKSLKKDASEEEMNRALTVILSIELLQAVFLVIDDVMDAAETRRGKPCWYKVEGIGMTALAHALRLQNYVNISIMKAIPAHKNLGMLFKMVWETIQATADGQELDEISNTIPNFTFDRYSQIVANKTSRYTFYYPISVAMLLADETRYLDDALQLSEAFGYYFQAQDDYLDFIDHPEQTGKTSSDIREAKCTWFSCKAVEKLANDPDNLREFATCYGQNDAHKIARCKEIMSNCQLMDAFKQFERQEVDNLKSRIASFPVTEARQPLEFTLKQLSGRKK